MALWSANFPHPGGCPDALDPKGSRWHARVLSRGGGPAGADKVGWGFPHVFLLCFCLILTFGFWISSLIVFLDCLNYGAPYRVPPSMFISFFDPFLHFCAAENLFLLFQFFMARKKRFVSFVSLITFSDFAEPMGKPVCKLFVPGGEVLGPPLVFWVRLRKRTNTNINISGNMLTSEPPYARVGFALLRRVYMTEIHPSLFIFSRLPTGRIY